MKYYSLHSHTGKSVFDAIGSVDDYVKAHISKVDSPLGFAVTDHGNLNSIGDLVATQKKYKGKGTDLKISPGLEAYYIDSLEDWKKLKEQGSEGLEEEFSDIVFEADDKTAAFKSLINRRYHLVLVAFNNKGYQNLCKLVSKSFREGFYRKPRIDRKMLEQHNEGLLISTACIAGVPAQISRENKDKDLEQRMKAYEDRLLPLFDIFGKDRAFLELQYHDLDLQQQANLDMVEFSKRSGYNLISVSDCHYPNREANRARAVYKMLGFQQTGKKIDKDEFEKKLSEQDDDLYLHNGEELFAQYEKYFKPYFDNEKLIKESIERTHEIGENLIEYFEPDDTAKLPTKFITFENKTSFQSLKELCMDALRAKGKDKDKKYIERLAEELKVIRDKQVADYFLTVKKVVDILRKHMLVGPARGSAGGSLVSYLLDIIQLDPIRNGLLFERFYSRNRGDYPDIDIDFSDKDKAIHILKEHFGEKNVLYITNYNRLNLKSLVKDIARLYDIPFEEVNNCTKKIEEEARDKILEDIGHDQKLYELTYERALKHSPTFKQFIDDHPEVSEHIDYLYKEIKSYGKHAAGIIITDDAEKHIPIISVKGDDQCPIQEGLTAQHAQLFGLVKIDILGLETLNTIKRCIEFILYKQGNENPTIQDVWEFYNKNLHPDVINPEDETVFEEVYTKGRFPAVFQFTEDFARGFAKRAQPQSVKEIAALTSIARPGPLKGGVDKLYVKAKRKGNVEYDHPVLEDVLGETYGYIVFQEQFMFLANKLAGFTLEESDKLRKRIVKPSTDDEEAIKKERLELGEKFVSGCVENGLSKERAWKLWEEEIMGFISYGFNKAHATGYAYISYQCAWLLAYYEEEWIRACLETDPDRDRIINDVASLGYEISKPDVLKSEAFSWSVKDGACVPSLITLKGVGEKAAEELIQKRSEKQINNIMDLFYDRETKQYKNGKTKEKLKWRFSKFNKTSLANLIKVEGFYSVPNCIGPSFENHRDMYEIVIGNFDKVKRGKLQELLGEHQEPYPDWSREERIEFQKEIMGTFDKELVLPQGVLDFFEERDIFPITDVGNAPRYHWFLLEDYKKATTKGGKTFYKLTISNGASTTKKLNIFDQISELKKHSLYITLLYYKGEWLNTPRGAKLVKAS